MKTEIWNWCFTKWYYWLVVALYFFYSIINDAMYNIWGIGNTIGSFIGCAAFIWIVFTLGRIIYLAVHNRKKTNLKDQK